MKIFFFLMIFFFSINSLGSEVSSKNMQKHDWSFNGITGTFDRAALQRGYKVYREVCSGCHSMRLLYYRNLINIGFSEAQVKVIASEYTVLDGPNDEGEMFERQARPSDKFVNPYLNDNEARANNNGAYPPDLSVITKARKYGVDYIYNLLLGYNDPPKDFLVGQGMYYNEWMPGNQIAMPSPLSDGSVDYDDGTDTDVQQLSEDVVTFLKWAAEPEMEVRKNLGIKVILFFIILGFVVYLAKNRLWREVN
jgi:ubiquinol-cytochrome c reductase cytochrome c1 subunit